MTIGELLAALDQAAPFSKAAGWDVVGLQVGDPTRPATRVAVCHELSQSVLTQVLAAAPQLVVSYHSLLHAPISRLTAGSSPAGRALALAEAGIGLGVVHTAFDVAPGGGADALADALGLSDLVGFAPLGGAGVVKIVTFVPPGAADAVADAMAATGAGQIGNYHNCGFRSEGVGTFFAAEGSDPVAGARGVFNREAEVRLEMTVPADLEARVVAALVAAHPYQEPAYDIYPRTGNHGLLGRVGKIKGIETLASLLERVQSRLGGVVRTAGDPAAWVSKVAVLPGAGSEFAMEARAAGAQAFVTGDVSHHRARTAGDVGIMMIDAGHARTEAPGAQRLLEWVQKAGVEVIDLVQVDLDPFWS